ncbi:hypothetical protein KEM60_02930 [Austwickia sp. TVS 96-490-7B]|uniref:hypothetical protein n=1 Tax=Austwickia sp. TVS 96-490-7B TaxID=2830843 RepID=UPI001C58E392|nr:hypothetical protein [Austwickia sp. TVS 96-490-7B]MBW3086701.1 hypothetical protein [Austwickia sp. TVS 96-490-7B]
MKPDLTLPEFERATLEQLKKESLITDSWVKLSELGGGLLVGFSINPASAGDLGEPGRKYGIWIEWDETDPLATMYSVVVVDAVGWAIDLVSWLDEELRTGLTEPNNWIEREGFIELHRPAWGESLLPEDLR